jgi:hypothetical protein
MKKNLFGICVLVSGLALTLTATAPAQPVAANAGQFISPWDGAFAADGSSQIIDVWGPLQSGIAMPATGLPASSLRVARRFAADDSLRGMGMVGAYNWSGYAATGANGSVSYVEGTWTVNAVTGSSGEYVAVWVGIDGFDSSTVEQLGTLAYITSSGFGRHATTVAEYYAWVEMYPAGMQIVGGAVQAGDTITASVQWAGGTSYKLYMVDNNPRTGWTYGPVAWTGSSSAEQNSAEWIVEAPSSGRGILPLADFGTESFSQCNATIAGQNGGANGIIGDFGSILEDITMVSEFGNRAMAVPSPYPLPSNATGFGDTWNGSGP